MDNANLSLIYPKHQVDVYRGIALLTLAAGALLTHNEAAKTVAMTTLLTSNSYFIALYYTKTLFRRLYTN